MIPRESTIKNPKLEEQFYREVCVSITVNHPNLVKTYDFAATKNNFYIVYEFCNRGSLEKYVDDKGGKLSEKEAIPFLKDICQGYFNLNKQGILHRDIKMANVFLKDEEGTIRAKLGDYGFAKQV